MLYNKKNFQVVEAASKSSIKPGITGVYITPSHTVATDSFVLARVSTPKDQDIKEFPEPPKGKNIKAKQVRAVIEPGVAKNLIKNMPKNKEMPVVENIMVTQFKGEQDITFTYTDIESWNENTSKVIQDEFPKYESIIPQGKPKARIKVNYKYLIKILKIAGRTTSRLDDVTIELYDDGDGKPIVIKSDDGQQDTLGLVMPLRDK